MPAMTIEDSLADAWNCQTRAQIEREICESDLLAVVPHFLDSIANERSYRRVSFSLDDASALIAENPVQVGFDFAAWLVLWVDEQWPGDGIAFGAGAGEIAATDVDRLPQRNRTAITSQTANAETCPP